MLLIIVYSLLGLWQHRNATKAGTKEFSTIGNATYKVEGLLNSYGRNHDKLTKGWPPPLYYASVTTRCVISFFTRPASYKYFDNRALTVAGKIFAYPWCAFWMIGFIYGLRKMNNNIILQFFAFLILYFACVTVDGDVEYQLRFSCAELDLSMYWLYGPCGEMPGGGEGTVTANADSPPSKCSNSIPGLFEVGLIPAEVIPGASGKGLLGKVLKDLGSKRARTVALPGGKRLASTGTFLRLLDSVARPRLFLGGKCPADEAHFRDELLLELALSARKFGHLPAEKDADDELARLFTAYAGRLVRANDKSRDDSRWMSAVDTVCMRLLLRAKPGRGIAAALLRRDAFRSYLRRALRCAMRPTAPRPAAPPSDNFPPTIAAAAERLEVSFSTVWRRWRAGGWPEWCPAAWERIQGELKDKRAWKAVRALEEQKTGKKSEAVRKAAYRARKAGRTPTDLVKNQVTAREESQASEKPTTPPRHRDRR
jgi:hypothetical protein